MAAQLSASLLVLPYTYGLQCMHAAFNISRFKPVSVAEQKVSRVSFEQSPKAGFLAVEVHCNGYSRKKEGKD